MQIYQGAGDDIAGAFGLGSIAAFMIDASILIPAAAALFAPILKDLTNKVIIPYFRKRFKIKPENDQKDNANE